MVSHDDRFYFRSGRYVNLIPEFELTAPNLNKIDTLYPKGSCALFNACNYYVDGPKLRVLSTGVPSIDHMLANQMLVNQSSDRWGTTAEDSIQHTVLYPTVVRLFDEHIPGLAIFDDPFFTVTHLDTVDAQFRKFMRAYYYGWDHRGRLDHKSPVCAVGFYAIYDQHNKNSSLMREGVSASKDKNHGP